MSKNTDPLYHTEALHRSINQTALTGDALVQSGQVFVPAVTAKRIQVASYHLTATTALTGSFVSNTGVVATNICGPILFPERTLVAAEYSPYGHMTTAAGEALAMIVTGGASTAGDIVGHLTYFEID
ncbi:MAG: hypothetical protein ACXABY_16830 [Candidatus Thorarchaeota archaeon]|jgi:hypothetical protein